MKSDLEDAICASRRKVLKSVAAGAGLAALPCASAWAVPSLGAGSAVNYAPTVALGYCPISSISDRGTTLATASSLRPISGDYELSVIGANTAVPLSVAAQYGYSASHVFWQAWQTQGLLQRSPPITIRWAASASNALPLFVMQGKLSGTAQVPAREGIYALAVVPATKTMPAWSSLLVKPVSNGGVSMRLLQVTGGKEATFPYVLFSVQSGNAASFA